MICNIIMFTNIFRRETKSVWRRWTSEDSKLAILLYWYKDTCCIGARLLTKVYCKQRIETLDGEDSKRFYLQYTFPPSCVGECGRVGAIGRREIGHGIMQCGWVGGWVGG